MATARCTAGRLDLPATQNRGPFAPEWLQQHATAHDLANMKRVGITSHMTLRVSGANIRLLAKQLGRDHALARAPWQTGWCEARMLAASDAGPAAVTPRHVHSWCRDLDN